MNTRRDFLQQCVAGAVLLSSSPLRAAGRVPDVFRRGTSRICIPLDASWRFCGKRSGDEMLQPGFDDSSAERIALPHCAVPLSWQDWKPDDWQHRWVYRRQIKLGAEMINRRVFLKLDGAMTVRTPWVNGVPLASYPGSYLPSKHEITALVKPGRNQLAMEVDGRWSNVPPQGAEEGPLRIDMLEPAGMIRSASLEIVPPLFIEDVFARPLRVLTASPGLQLDCTLDSAQDIPSGVRLTAVLKKEGTEVGRAEAAVPPHPAGRIPVQLDFPPLAGIHLWSFKTPELYDIEVTLWTDAAPVHQYRVRTGFREARFDPSGFYLNGEKTRLFGLNRHEIFPYTGFAMPPRVMRRDAQILKHGLNCNAVRSSHYPPHEAFLDACDELGLAVWDEVPGWKYIGDEEWQALFLRNVEQMILRDRNHPSVVIWGIQVNESRHAPELYSRAKQTAKRLDAGRPTVGNMTITAFKRWKGNYVQDVLAVSDYHPESAGGPGIYAPEPDMPHIVSETVGQCNYFITDHEVFDQRYRKAGDLTVQKTQAVLHASAHSKAAGYERMCGALGWCAFDYASLRNDYRAVKAAGVMDVFRLPKLGAAFYQTQGSPAVRPVIQPGFYWDFGPNSPNGPGLHSAIFSNCERLALWIDGSEYGSLFPDREGFPDLAHAPFFADLEFKKNPPVELRIDGYVAGQKVITRQFSADASHDRLWMMIDDDSLCADGIDATRIAFYAGDCCGAPRAFATGEVSLRINGPGKLIGDNPFRLDDSGGSGAIWLRSLPGETGRTIINAEHPVLGAASVQTRFIRGAVNG